MITIFIAVALVLTACACRQSPLKVHTPSRPAGQEDVVGLACEPMDTVRIGVVGLGMRGNRTQIIKCRR